MVDFASARSSIKTVAVPPTANVSDGKKMELGAY
jgi:hypothetical protein